MNFNSLYIDKIRNQNEREQLELGRGKTFAVLTYGCQQNESDSEKIKGMLVQMGYGETEDREAADVVVINTCCIRENAELKFFGTLGSLKKSKQERPEKLIALCGCMMQQEHIVEEIKKKYRFVDIVFGTHNLHHLPELMDQAMEKNGMLVEVLHVDGTIVEEIPVCRSSRFQAGVSIMYGCNNYCSYCVVPYVRGRERSRQPEDILKEVQTLAADGCKEVMLLGQNVNSYGKDLTESMDFADLLRAVNEIAGIERIRFMTSHPKDISDKLIQTMAECEHVCRQLHLPCQAGSSRVLKAMNRKYTKEEYLDKVRRVREAMPEIALSTDIIVGFPGETDADFAETLELMKQVRFDQAFMFIYSKRAGTPAAAMENQVPSEKQHENLKRLMDLQDQICFEINQTYLGKVVDVLVEGPSKTDKTKFTGRTETGKAVNFTGAKNTKIGDIVPVQIMEAKSWSLNGEQAMG